LLSSRIEFSSTIVNNLKLEFVAFESKRDFYTEIYFSAHFYINASKHKSLLRKINFCQPKIKHAQFWRQNQLYLRAAKHVKINFTLRRSILDYPIALFSYLRDKPL
jgi:hypothetical protein